MPAKEELLERRRTNLDLTDYANLNIGEIVSGYVNQVHKSRDVEISMVNQIQQKSEVLLFFLLAYCIVILLSLPYSSPQDYL